MAEYNPSKIIKDGNTYNFRDNTKIPLAGSNQISGSLIPATTDAYDLGSSSYQWNNAYIKSLTINGKAPAYDNEVVHKAGDEAITGLKSFFDVGRYYIDVTTKSTNFLNFKVLNIELNSETNLPTKNYTLSQNITSITPALYLGNYYSITAQGLIGTDIRNYKYGSSKDWTGISIRYALNDETYITVKSNRFNPSENNTTNLGSPSLQWNNTYTRNILIDNDINIASSLINKTSTSGVISIRGGLNTQDGASIGLYGKDYNGGIAGNIYMTAYGNSDYTNFRIYPNGVMSVYNNSTSTTKNVAMQEDTIPRNGGAVMTDYFLGRSADTGSFMLNGGTAWDKGGSIELFGANNSDSYFQGYIRIQPAKDSTTYKKMELYPNGTWTWDGTACQITSDQRLKQQISQIDDDLLTAWEGVEPVQFKYNDAVEEKSDNARLHTGYVVQQIDEACKSHGVDVSKYGLYCHEEYAEETREVEQADGTKTVEVVRPANEHYSLRYTEALIVECAYLRKCIKELRAEIEELKSSK